jgi:hypothetical protein
MHRQLKERRMSATRHAPQCDLQVVGASLVMLLEPRALGVAEVVRSSFDLGVEAFGRSRSGYPIGPGVDAIFFEALLIEAVVLEEGRLGMGSFG